MDENDLKTFRIRSPSSLNGLIKRFGWLRLALHEDILIGWDAGEFTHGDYAEQHGQHINLNVQIENGKYILEFSKNTLEYQENGDSDLIPTSPSKLRGHPIFQKVFNKLDITFRDHDTWNDIEEDLISPQPTP
jgi:hypothetical protein